MRLLIAAVMVLTLLSPAALSEQVNHIILFVGDGMHLESELAASRYLYGSDGRLSFQKLPYKGVVATWDVTAYNNRAAQSGMAPYNPLAIVPVLGYDPQRGGTLPFPLQTDGIDTTYFVPGGSPVKKPFATDSASAATAWTTGYKTDDGNIAWLPGDPPDGRRDTIAEILRTVRGFALGVVSTVPFSHATPAAHVSHNVNRNNYKAIAEEIVNAVKPEVVIGGGYPTGAPPVYQYLSEATHNQLKNSTEYVFVQREAGKDGAETLIAAADQAVAQGKKLFGLFGGKDGNFESPVPKDQPGAPEVARASIENPLLQHAVVAALKVLSQDPDGFFVMIEQGDIDWAAHANDYGRIVGTVWDLHEAVNAAIDFIDRPGDDITWGNTLLVVTSDHSTGFLRLSKPLEAGDLPAQGTPVKEACPDYFSATTCPTYPDGEVAFGTTYHTSELTRLYARGHAVGHFNQYEGVWYPCTHIIDNTQLFHILLDASGVRLPSALNTIQEQLSCAGK